MPEPQLNLEGAVRLLRDIQEWENEKAEILVQEEKPNPILTKFESWALSQGLDPSTAFNVVASGMAAAAAGKSGI